MNRKTSDYFLIPERKRNFNNFIASKTIIFNELVFFTIFIMLSFPHSRGVRIGN